MIEFTGERVIPGRVSEDLWSEHLARYAFARRFAKGKLVLDAGCGTGYGCAELAQVAHRVIGIDSDPEAMAFAVRTYPLQNISFAAARCESLPFRDGTFDLLAAFEVIEHLQNYRQFLAEATRVLKPQALFIVSTPNKRYYASTRVETGPNPYHEHEFEASEFSSELNAQFAHVCLFAQNRVEAFAFHPFRTFWPSDVRIDRGAGTSDDAHFFIAICSQSPLPELRSFTYVPKAANILRERELHIKALESQLAETGTQRDEILELFRNQTRELEEHNRWAQQRVAELESENDAKTRWAREVDECLTAKCRELAECVRLLDRAEATVTERTLWAQRAEAHRQELEAILNAVRASRWLGLGRRIGVGPAI